MRHEGAIRLLHQYTSRVYDCGYYSGAGQRGSERHRKAVMMRNILWTSILRELSPTVEAMAYQSPEGSVIDGECVTMDRT